MLFILYAQIIWCISVINLRYLALFSLIATGTIEEKIIALHQTKKSLADALLEGSDVATALDRDEILKLIRGDEA